MTLARTALRLCISAALKGEVGNRPTIAEERIYDSRLSDYAPDTFGPDAKATVAILTDNDDGEALSRQNGGPPFKRDIDVVLEIGMTVRIKDGNEFLIGYPDTDARLEAALDTLEFQIQRRLSDDPSPMPTLFRKIARIWKVTSHRQVLDNAAVKAACRLVTLSCQVSDDQVQRFNSAGVVPSGIDALPEPLRTVAQHLPAGSSGKQIVDTIASALTGLTIPPFTGVDTIIDAADAVHDEGDDREVALKIDVPQVDPPTP